MNKRKVLLKELKSIEDFLIHARKLYIEGSDVLEECEWLALFREIDIRIDLKEMELSQRRPS